MAIRILTETADLQRYDAWVRTHPQGSLWQSSAWKALQDHAGREVRIYTAEENGSIVASALVVIDRTAFNWCTWELPRGPLWAEGSGQKAVGSLLSAVIDDATADRCLALYCSPSNALPPTPYPLRPSPRHQMPDATRVLDLTQADEVLLAQMRPKGRYNIGLAEKNSVDVQPSKDIDAFYTLMKETGGRDGFGILPKSHYEAFLNRLPNAFLLLAYPPSPSPNPIAGLLGVLWNGIGIYYYGASDYAHRALMAPYALQWKAIQHCKAQGCRSYDLLGVAPPESGPGHPWSGISVFKEKFGGTVITYPHEQMLVLRRWRWRILQVKRRLWK